MHNTRHEQSSEPFILFDQKADSFYRSFSILLAWCVYLLLFFYFVSRLKAILENDLNNTTLISPYSEVTSILKSACITQATC